MAKYFHFYDDVEDKGDLSKGAIGVLEVGYDGSYIATTIHGTRKYQYADPVEVVPTQEFKAMREHIESMSVVFNSFERELEAARERIAELESMLGHKPFNADGVTISIGEHEALTKGGE